MINQYTKPQDTITLLLERVLQGVAKRNNPVVIAPQYLLSRRGSETLPAVAWTVQTTIALRYDNNGISTALPTTYVADIGDVSLWGDSLMLSLDDDAGRQWQAVDGLSKKLRTEGGEIIADLTTSTRDSDLRRNLAVGDSLICSDESGSAVVRRRITALVGQEYDASLSEVIPGTFNPNNNAAPTAAAFTSNDFDAAHCLVNSGDWSALVSGSKVAVGDKMYAGEIFIMTFSHPVGTVGTAQVTVVKTSTGVSQTVEATRVASYYDDFWHLVIPDPDTGNKLDVWLENKTYTEDLSVHGFTATLTIFSSYTVSNYSVTATGQASYTGLVDTRVVVEVIAGGATYADKRQSFRISDSKGRGQPQTTTPAATTSGVTFTYLGLTLHFPQAAYRKNDLFYFDVTAAGESKTLFDGVVLDGPAYDTGVNHNGLNVIGHAATAFTGRIPDSWCSAWSLASNVLEFGGITFTSGALTGLEAISGYGTISAGFRAIVPVPASETWVTIYNADEIEAALGPVDMDNPVAYSVSKAIGGTQGTPVYALRVGGVDESDFSAGLIKISNSDMVYALTIAGTQTAGVFTLLKDHCEAQSVPTKKNFRRVYLGVDSPGEYLRVGANSMGDTAKARILPYGQANTLLAFSAEEGNVNVDMVAAGVRVGDVVKVYNGTPDVYGNPTAVEYEIESLVDPEEGGKTTQALLVTGPAQPIEVNTIAEVWAADSADNQIDYLVSIARSLGSRRAIVVWCEGGTTTVNGASASVSSEYIAAEISGLRCALLPQEGLTTYELTSVTSAPAMYTRYTEEQLNRAAANGIMVVCQEYPTGPVFIRHQLTTDTNNGLLAWEDSVGVNLDDQGFQVKDAFVGYRGRKNVTERTRKEIEDQLFQLVFNMTQALVSEDAGPQITGFSNEAGEANKVTVKFHPTFKDRFITFYRPGMPVPLNGIDHTIYGEVQDVI